MNEPIYHLDTAAERCGVSRETILSWIARGLRAFPLGHSTEYRPRDFLIREVWLLDFLDAMAQVEPKSDEIPKRKLPRIVSRPLVGMPTNILGPCPV